MTSGRSPSPRLTLIGTHLGHYRILRTLGEGGMGVVYAAEDTRLDRHIALKVARRDEVDSPERLAFLQREARAAAALNHPNIVHLYSVEESGGLTFITMELVRGRTLRELMSGGAPLPIGRTLALASQVAEGLAFAHDAGVLHRDLKPGNIMVTDDDRVKILDFGVAKRLKSAATDGEAATRAEDNVTIGMVVGTIGYMSPEQALGQPLDAATDLFALGAVLFEMATGRAPFQGDTTAAVFDQLLNRRPSAPRVNPAVPHALAAIIDKALEKERERRYRSAGELLHDLRRVDAAGTSRTSPLGSGIGSPIGPPVGSPIGSPGSSPGPSSITSSFTSSIASSFTSPLMAPGESRAPSTLVVLPFVDMSPEQDQAYFCDGITEEIISTLTTVPGLRVMSRTSAFAFQGRGLDITEIGRRLGVGVALEGSVRKAGTRVRVTAQLVNAENGYQLWSRRFDSELSDVFAIQDEIAATIVEQLRIGLAGPPPKRAPSDVVAHDAYLRGKYAMNKWRDDAMRQAIADFREAIARDAGFAPAYAALAEGYVWLYSGLGVVAAHETVPHARWGVENALALDPALAEAHKVGALIAMNHDWDRKGAEEALARAMQCGPGSAAVHLWNAWRLALLERRHDQAMLELEEAERLDPLDLQVKTQIGYLHSFRHDLDRAIEQFERVLMLEPGFAFAHYALGDAYTQRGEYDRAFASFHKAVELGGRSANHTSVLGYAYGRAGERDRAQEHLHELTARAAQAYVSPMWVALIHLGLSDYDSLFEWLNRAVEERDGSLILITAAVEFDPVRDDPRFTSLLRRMGLGYLA